MRPFFVDVFKALLRTHSMCPYSTGELQIFIIFAKLN